MPGSRVPLRHVFSFFVFQYYYYSLSGSRGMAGSVGRPRGTTSTMPRRFVLARLVAACRHGRTVLRCPRWSRQTVSRSPSDSLDSLAGQPTRLSCGGDGRARLSCGARRTVLIVLLDTRRTVLRRWCKGWTAAAVIARLADGVGDRRRYVCEMDATHMGQRLRNTIYLYVGYWFLNMGLVWGRGLYRSKPRLCIMYPK
jgi:hypothetical protein